MTTNVPQPLSNNVPQFQTRPVPLSMSSSAPPQTLSSVPLFQIRPVPPLMRQFVTTTTILATLPPLEDSTDLEESSRRMLRLKRKMRRPRMKRKLMRRTPRMPRADLRDSLIYQPTEAEPLEI